MENHEIPVYFGSFDGQPSRFDSVIEAWVLSEDRSSWKEINAVSHGHAVRELSKEEFERRYPGIPPLPPEAFKRAARFLAALAPSQREVVWMALVNHPKASLSEAIEILDAAGL